MRYLECLASLIEELMPNITPTMSANEIDSSEKSAFIRAGQGTLELGDLMTAAERLNASGRKDAAAELYRLWLEHTTSPHAYVACFNLGTTLSSIQDYHQAEVMYRKALDLNPGLIQARLNLGTCLEQQKRDEDALDQWRAALATDSITLPENKLLRLHALNNLGRLLEIKKQYLTALEMLEKSFSVDPTQRDVLIHLVHLTQKICKWPIYNPPKGTIKLDMIKYTSPLAMLAISDDPDLQLSVANRFVEYKYPVINSEVLAPKEGYQHKKIRIGYLSSDLSMHAVSLLTVELFELHMREMFEVYGFCWSREDGTAFRQRVIAGMDHFIRIGQMDDRQAAETIRAHEIDIIVDLQGLTSGARPLILSYRPAPMQITYLGFPGPTGLPWIDYVVADRYLIPESTAHYFSEKPLYMPGCFQVSDSKREVAPMPSRAEYFLPEDAFVFCSFNNNYKYTPEMFAAWMRILKKVPKSVLWLLADNEWAQENLINAAKKHGIKKDRLIFAPRVVPSAYLARYQLADLFLDTFPFNGGTTANDALFMGLPLLTLSGRSLASRYAGSLLTNLGFPELITQNVRDYEEKAVWFARNQKARQEIRARMGKCRNNSQVFDTAVFVKGYELELARVYEEHTLVQAASSCVSTSQTSVINTKDMSSPNASIGDLAIKTGFPIKPTGMTDNLFITACGVRLYTIVYSPESLKQLEPGFNTLDHMKNDRSDWREYWPVRNYLLRMELDENALYGFFSPKFRSKTGLSHADVLSFMGDRSADVYTFSPQPDMGSFFLNVFEQNDVFDPGFKALSQELFNNIGYSVDLNTLVMDSRHVVFSNFIVANRRFWMAWLDLCEKIFSLCEAAETELARKLNEPTSYQGVPRKVFMVERIASLLLKTGHWQIRPYNTFKCAWSALGTNRFKDEAVISDTLKLAHNELGYPEHLAGFSEIRKRVFFSRK
jgi:predicted O-linked N-acetylglucosamine transferase (SPINDLY family)